MATLYVPAGLPGCGKTTYAETLDAVRISSDDIRRELFGDASVQFTEELAEKIIGKTGVRVAREVLSKAAYERYLRSLCNDRIFNYMDSRVWQALNEGKNVYYDATNLTHNIRRDIVHRFRHGYSECVAVYFDVPEKVCQDRNLARDRRVPDYAMGNMALRFKAPQTNEGFSRIIRVDADGKEVA